MGKASKWFRGLLALKKPDSSSPSPTSSAPTPPKDRRRWTFVKSYRQNDHLHVPTVKPGAQDPDNQAIAVAEEAVPAAAVPRGTCAGVAAEGTGNREEWAAVKIQAAFRGCLLNRENKEEMDNPGTIARRALRALKGLVKLQALVRGYIERKRTAEWLQRMLVLLRAQARVRAGRDQILLNSSSSVKSSNGPATPHKFENPFKSKSLKYDQSSILKRNGSKSYVQINGNQEKCWNTAGNWVDEQPWNQQRSSIRTCRIDDERNARIQEIDSMKPYLTPKHTNLFHSTNRALVSDQDSQSLITTNDSTTHQSGPSHSCEVQQSYSLLKVHEVEESPFCVADGSPQIFSASSRDGGSKRSPFTPTRSDGSRSYLSGYSDYPNYMAYTESSMAKVRSLSAPKQRPQYERSSSSNRYSINGFGASRLTAQRVSALHASITSKAYPGSGRLDKLGMPAGYRY